MSVKDLALALDQNTKMIGTAARALYTRKLVQLDISRVRIDGLLTTVRHYRINARGRKELVRLNAVD